MNQELVAQWLTENDIIGLLEAHFLKQNYSVAKVNTKQKGVDMIVTSTSGEVTYIEAKGETSASETSKRYGQPFSGNQIWSHVSVALLKTFTDMCKPENDDKKFALAFPENHRELMERIKPIIEKLGIAVYFVERNKISTL